MKLGKRLLLEKTEKIILQKRALNGKAVQSEMTCSHGHTWKGDHGGIDYFLLDLFLNIRADDSALNIACVSTCAFSTTKVMRCTTQAPLD